MKRKLNEINVLAFQVKQGNVQARERLRNLLVPGVALIVRRTLHTGNVRSALSRQIFHEFRRVAAVSPVPAAKVPAAVAEQIARRLADRLVDGLRERTAGVDLMRETVVA